MVFGHSYLELNHWDEYRENICYSNKNMYCEERHYRTIGYKVIEFEDIDLGENIMKKKLRDWTSEEIDEYCRSHKCCGECPLKVNENEYLCNLYKNYKKYLNDKTLDIELDIPFKEILDKADKETLIYHCLLLRREHCEPLKIIKYESDCGTNYIYFYYKDNYCPNCENVLRLPIFEKSNMYKNMIANRDYTLQKLDIDLDKYELELKEKQNDKKAKAMAKRQ